MAQLKYCRLQMSEKARLVYWSELKPYHQHIALMFLMRQETMDDWYNTLERVRYEEFKIKKELIPRKFIMMTPKEKHIEAYKVIGEPYPY